ncbi:transposase [Listeria monocytogenes]|nr:transposase [Listeria monocytogenes]KES76261.1 transposase [Listeria monocytogenes]KES90748.1 transposase [Listeria monocytogenes]KET22799.1 transposase [Listeria monocytogenes]KET64659.1 transposase [Listeria monocytogenes]
MNYFKGKQFQKEVIIVSVGYYLRSSKLSFL